VIEFLEFIIGLLNLLKRRAFSMAIAACPNITCRNSLSPEQKTLIVSPTSRRREMAFYGNERQSHQISHVESFQQVLEAWAGPTPPGARQAAVGAA